MFFPAKTVGIVNSLNTRQSVFTVFPDFSDFYLAKIVLVKTKPLIIKIYFAFDELRQLFVLTPVLLIIFLVIELFIGGLPVDLYYCLKSFRLRQKRKMS